MPEKQMEQEEQQRKRKKGIGQNLPQAPQEDEETDEYLDWPSRSLSFNKAKSAFDQGTFQGINTDKNVFDKEAVFHTEDIL